MFVLSSCSSKQADTSWMQYLGDYSYDAPITAMVYEPVEGEDDYGIQYREVKDLGGLVGQSEIAVCLYFYSSLDSDVYAVTAGVEDMAQGLTDRVLFISIDAVEMRDISSAYQIEAIPEFVLINNGARISTFEGMNYDYWTIDDVVFWLDNNGYEIDYSRLQ